MQTIYYTYLIGWSHLNKYYYGKQSGKKANPENLWKTYFTSSRYVKDYRLKFGEPDIIEIRKTFDAPEKCCIWEQSVLRRLKIYGKDKWLNKSISGWYVHDLEINKKISEGNKGRKFTDEHKRKLSLAKIGRKISKEHAEKLHNGRRDMIVTDEYREKIIKASKEGYQKWLANETEEKERLQRISRLGKKASIETKEKLRQAQIRRYLDPEERLKTSIATKKGLGTYKEY